MATYNEKGTLPSEGDANVGLDPTSTGENRQFFWNDRFVEPKQQHRFTIKIPIYTPNGPKKDSLRMAQAIKARLKSSGPSEDGVQSIFQSLGGYETGRNLGEVQTADGPRTATINSINIKVKLDATDSYPNRETLISAIQDRYGVKVGSNIAPAEDLYLKALGIYEAVGNLYKDNEGSSIFKSNSFSTADENNLGSNDDLGLFMRVSEYVGYSFTPPGFNYSPADIGQDGEGNTLRIEGLGSYGRSSATLTFVTTLRDDLHFSLNLLWALSTSASDGSRKSSVRLFDPFLTGELADSEKVVTIYEHYARQTKDGNGASINDINEYAIAGIHKIYDPYIESVTFGEFSYGGSELIKITMNLTYGGQYNQSNFYSYQITEDRYGQGTVYAMDQGSYARAAQPFQSGIYPSAGPIPGSKRLQLTYKSPNTGSSNSDLRDLTFGELKERKNALLIEKNIERLETRRILEGGSKIDKNNLVTKGISEIIAAREEAAEAALDDQRVRRRDTSFLDEAAREQSEQRQRREQESDRRRQEIDNYIATTQARLDRERQQGAATPPTPADFDPP